MNTIKITLSAYNLGQYADEDFFDKWAEYVCDNILDDLDLHSDLEVEQFLFETSPDQDLIISNSNDETELIRNWLNYTGWEKFCNENNKIIR